jgi:hypothetical protein
MEQYIKDYLVLAGCLGFGLIYFIIVWSIQKLIYKSELKRIEEDPSYMPWD